MKTYTIMIDEGIGDFLWVNDGKDTGSNVGGSILGLGGYYISS